MNKTIYNWGMSQTRRPVACLTRPGPSLALLALLILAFSACTRVAAPFIVATPTSGAGRTPLASATAQAPGPVTEIPTQAASPSPSPTPTPTPPPSATPGETPTADISYTQCGWQWATQPLPEESERIRQALLEAGLPLMEAWASAYGENCLNSQGQVLRFAVMQTDIQLSLKVVDANDETALGDWLEQTLRVLAQFGPGQLPGPNSGSVALTFQDEKTEVRIWFERARGETALQNGLRGADLWRALLNP